MRVSRGELAVEIGRYYTENRSTIRDTARYFGISKSSVHNYLVKVLPKVNVGLAKDAQRQLRVNFNEKHIRGGLALRSKYANLELKRRRGGSKG